MLSDERALAAAGSGQAPPPRAPAPRSRFAAGFRGKTRPYARLILLKLGALALRWVPRALRGSADASLRKIVENKPQGVLSPAD